MSSPSDSNTDRLKFIEFASFEQLTPWTTRNSSNKLFWAVFGKDKIPVVLKFAGDDEKNRGSDTIKLLENELTLLSNVLPHQNIIKFFGLTRDSESDEIFAVTQYVTGGNLRQYLKQQNSILSWNDRIRFSMEIASGLCHIHDAGLSHRNLHPNNVLVRDGHMMISDLGFSSVKYSSSSYTHFNEMIPFIEPLYLKDQSYCLDKRSDIYSFGVIMFELASGRSPFEILGPNYQLLLDIIINGDRDPSIIPAAPVPYTELYRLCWDADPSKRPTIEEVMKLLANIRLKAPEIITRPPAEIKFQADPRRHARTSVPFMSMPAISPRVDSIGWRDSTNDFSEYDVIDKNELKGYSAGNVYRRREKSRSLSFGAFRRQGQSEYESNRQLHYSASMNERGSLANVEYLDIGANAPLFDSRQPKIILIARYCPAKSIVKVFEQLKRRKVDLTLREAYKSKSVFHSLIWNDDLFDMISINHSQQKLPRHNDFRAALKWLTSNNLDINSVDDFGWTALHEAIWKRREPGVILALLENHANPNIPDKLGATPLHQCLDLLRTTTRDHENRPIFLIIRLLLQFGADPNLTLPETTLTISGSSLPNCLFAAVYMDLPLDIIELMIKRGADTASATFRGLHLLDFTAKINNTTALRYLTENKNLLNAINKRSGLFNSLKINSKVGSAPFTRAGSIPTKYEKSSRKKRWGIAHSR